MTESRHPYHDFLHRVEKPARYTGGEFLSVQKDWDTTDVRYALCFPDVYDIGMSHLGTKILYKLVNDLPWALGERAFSPWFDLEEKLRELELPLVSLETWRPLSEFDVVGFSLQYEMTYTNVLNMLDLGGIPLRNADRTIDDPFVIAGGPSATHPEPITPFVDALVIGDGEETLPQMLAVLRQAKKEGWSRDAVLVAWAKMGGVYCPELYTRDVVDDGGFVVVTGTTDPEVPARVKRSIIEDIDRYPFPDDSPVAAAEAIFDRMSIEIARGCTEGCRFCQAGMVYRPVRERSPKEVVKAVMGAIEKAGYDEVSLSCLSTADYSCISPLIKEIAAELKKKNTTLSVASLRAYGLADDLLEEIGSIRATSLTFAPEAGTQRMRDVINKNITEENLHTTAHRVFSRNWQRVKCYFMIGLPTEDDDDVHGIIETARKMRQIGRMYKRSAEITVSVSSHVPKPHTPFQWAAMDTPEQIEYKHDLLYHGCKANRLKLRRHGVKISYLEGVIGRGDRRLGDAIELAWKKGARFDGWDRHLKFDAWTEAFAELDIQPDRYLARLREDIALPWDHIDVGLDDGFLLREWKRALKNRLSPPCGKPKNLQVHHTNVADAVADERKLICYHCGVACDMTAMRDERVTFLKQLGALDRVVKLPETVADDEAAVTVAATGTTDAAATPATTEATEASQKAQATDTIPAVEVAPAKPPRDPSLNARGKPRKGKKTKHPPRAPYMGPVHRYRLRFSKQGAESLTSHLDLVRSLPRIFRRAGLPLRYSDGFHPKPVVSFAPALPLGTRSVDEVMDVDLMAQLDAGDVLARLKEAETTGLRFLTAEEVQRSKHKLVSHLEEARYRVELRPGVGHPPMSTDDERETARRTVEQALYDFIAADHVPGTVIRKKQPREMDIRPDVVHLGMDADGQVRVAMRLHGGATVRPQEVVNAALGGLGWFVPTEPVHIERTNLILRTPEPAAEAATAVPDKVADKVAEPQAATSVVPNMSPAPQAAAVAAPIG
ncbi:MAG: TIGR03960 family B12-binding radical SAM protein [Myxococcales bacterium]|nr:TIGR03960 family B12-binding radical SAM protein [Myxococcales bacterium]